MSNGNFKQLVRTIRNWKNEGIHIKENTTIITKGRKSTKDNLPQKENSNNGLK